MSTAKTFSRRKFLKTTSAAGGGLVLGFYLPTSCTGKKTQMTGPISAFSPNAFIKIGTDESISIIANHSEMGQGIYTSLCQLVADELEVEWENIKVEHAPIDPAFNHTLMGPIQATGNSMSALSEWTRMRQVGASTKQMLVRAAAEEWGIDPSECLVESGVVKANGKSLTYGALAEKASALTPPDLESVSLKDPKDFNYISKPVKRLDTRIKSNGEAIFGMDVAIPNMLVAVIARPPVVYGSKVHTFDPASAMAVPGVKHVVEIDRGVAIVADGFWNAKKGRDALKVTWENGPNGSLSTENQGEDYANLIKNKGIIAEERGNLSEGFGQAVKTINATYELPYLAHTTMEPMNCIADVREDGCDIFLGTQMPTLDQYTASQYSGFPPEKIKVNNQYLGGGFGRKSVLDGHIAAEAVQVSKAVGAPVKIIWTREDDIRGGYYRPRSLSTIKASVNKDGNPIAWEHHITVQSFVKGTALEQMLVHEGVDHLAVEGVNQTPYKIPNFKVTWHEAEAKVPCLWMRGVGHSFNAFCMETMIDELAEAAGKDAYEFRKELLLEDARSSDTLTLAVEKSKWGQKLPEGHALGMAIHSSYGSCVAQVAEVSIVDGWPKVHNVVAAIDCGPYINPDAVKAQIEGSVIFGLTSALYGELTLANGATQQSNFHDYRMVRMHESPFVDVHIVESSKEMGGVGEPGVPPIAPAVANALYKLTGKRMYSLPFTKHKKDFE